MTGKAQLLERQDLGGKWCDGMKLLNLHIFNKWQVSNKPVSVEITYGLERICMFTQQKKMFMI